MPKVKRENTVIHPNSRKALQLARQVYHNEKLEKRKGESSLKVKAKTTKLKWFKEHLDTAKEMYLPADVKQLIDKYLNRFTGDKIKETEAKSLKRHSSGHSFTDFKSKFLIEKEKAEFSTCGIEIPDIMTKENFQIFKAWNGDSQLLPTLVLVKVSKKLLDKKESTYNK